MITARPGLRPPASLPSARVGIRSFRIATGLIAGLLAALALGAQGAPERLVLSPAPPVEKPVDPLQDGTTALPLPSPPGTWRRRRPSWRAGRRT